MDTTLSSYASDASASDASASDEELDDKLILAEINEKQPAGKKRWLARWLGVVFLYLHRKCVSRICTEEEIGSPQTYLFYVTQIIPGGYWRPGIILLAVIGHSIFFKESTRTK